MKKLTNAQLLDMVNSLASRIEDLEAINYSLNTKIEKLETKRGPESSRKMTEEDAKRILLGDLKDVGHKQCAVELGLSYGQVYSCRGGYTFKAIHDEILAAKK